MTITIYSDVILPSGIVAAGLAGVTEFNNTASVNQGGFESVNINWQFPLREYELGFVALPGSVWKQIQATHLVCKGNAYGFLMLDPVDQTVLVTEGKMTGTAGSAGPYTLSKRYTAWGGARYADRIIKRPLASSLVCYVNGVARAYTLNSTTGQITFSVAPSVGQTLSWSGSYYIAAHFRDAVLPWELVRGGNINDRLVMGQNLKIREVRE